MIGKLMAGIAAPVLIVYGAYVLWPNSHCDRVSNAAVPAYWAGNLIKLGAEPFVDDPESLADLHKYPERIRGFMAGAIAKVFYDRDSYAMLCATDPIELYRRAGRLDSRGLVALTPEKAVPAQDKVRAIQYAMSSSAGEAPVYKDSLAPATPGSAAPAAPATPETWSQWFARVWPWLLMILAAAVVFIAPVRKVVLESIFSGKILSIFLPLLRRLWAAHKQVGEHLLPRDVIRPSAGKRRTDLTD